MLPDSPFIADLVVAMGVLVVLLIAFLVGLILALRG